MLLGRRAGATVTAERMDGVPGPLVVVTDRGQAEATGRHLVDVVAAAVDAGARTFLLREKDLPVEERAALAKAVAELLAAVDGMLLVASDWRLAEAVGAAGVHLATTDSHPAAATGVHLAGADAATAQLPAGTALAATIPERRLLVGRSCHSVAELRAAQGEGADYVTYSPVWGTASKPGYGPAFGTAGLAEGAAGVPGLPVYALGGIGPGRAAPCRAAGAAGVAVMGAIMRAADPETMVRELLAELATTKDDEVRAR